MHKAYRHIIWDWNGTLLDDAGLCIHITNGLLESRGLERLDAQRYQRLFDFPVRLYYERLGFDLEAESFEELGTEFIAAYERRRFECRLQAGARNVLEAISARGLSQSILSAYNRRSLEEIVKHHGLDGFFVELVGLDDHYAAGKVAHGRAWIRRMEHDPRQVLLVGDTVHDYEVACEIGTDCVLLPCGHHAASRLEACGVPVLLSLPALTEWLFS